MKIGPYNLDNRVILAPMAGVTDRPFRIMCREMGAALAVSEMVTSNRQLWNSRKTRLRLDHHGEASPRSIQIAGTDPHQMAEAARFNVDNGAQIIDINMGCPAKKVCNVLAGSALLQNESLVADILHAVVDAIEVPVTLKIRTGWDRENRNAVNIAHIAESAGIQALAVHGRTRDCAYKGQAEYDTITAVKNKVKIPIIANGDIDSPRKAAEVLAITGADAIMIGRAAQGRPWIFREINHFLQNGTFLKAPDANEVNKILLNHLKNLYDFYGKDMGVKIARKHISWYCRQHAKQLKFSGKSVETFRQLINKVESPVAQLEQVAEFFTSNNNLIAA